MPMNKMIPEINCDNPKLYIQSSVLQGAQLFLRALIALDAISPLEKGADSSIYNKAIATMLLKDEKNMLRFLRGDTIHYHNHNIHSDFLGEKLLSVEAYYPN